MAHPDIMESMRRSMATGSPASESTETDTTAEGSEEASSEEADAGTPAEEGDGDGADGQDGDGAGEGEEGSDESGSHESESDETTAEGEDGDASQEEQASEEGEESEGEKPEEEKPADKWDAEEEKAVKDWLGKDAAKLKADPVTRKLLKIARDNHASALEAKQTTSALNDHIAGIGELLLEHNFEKLNELAEELGADKLPFDARTPDDLMKEAAETYNAVYDALEKGLKENKEAWALVQNALDPYYRKVEGKIQKLKEDATIRKAEQAGRKAAGRPVRGSLGKQLEDLSIQHFTDLKAKDPKAQARFDALKKYASGGLLRDMKRLYAHNPKLADELGKHVEFSVNFQKEYLPKIRKAMEGELKAKKLLKAPPSGRRTESGPTGGAGAAPKPKVSNFDHYAGNRIASRLR